MVSFIKVHMYLLFRSVLINILFSSVYLIQCLFLYYLAVIPFGHEKDLDFQIFSLDESRVLSIINEALQSKSSWSNIKVDNSDFGYQLGLKSMLEEHGFRYYIDFWLFNDKFEGDKIQCTGRKQPKSKTKTGCQIWYDTYFVRRAPIFEREDYFPPVYQVFGSHKVPIPAKSTDLEGWQYRGETEHWNTTCGGHRNWDFNLTRFVDLPKEKRVCSRLYDERPFVFKVGNCLEELRQGGVVLHRSTLTE